MYKKTITFEDYNGRMHTEDYYFHLRQSDLVDMEMGENGRMTKLLSDIIKTEDQTKIVGFIKTLIMKSYGIKSEDGLGFDKSEEIWRKFANTEAYSVLFMELATNADKAAEFVRGIIPQNMQEQVDQVVDSDLPPEEQLKALENLSREELLEKFKAKTEEKKAKKKD